MSVGLYTHRKRMSTEEVTLGTEVREKQVFVFGNWGVGELRIPFDELQEFTTGSVYSPAELSGKCASCKEEYDHTTDTLYTMQISSVSIRMCGDCRSKLKETLRSTIKSNISVITSDTI